MREVAPGIIWVAALLAAMLSLDSVFRSDFEDGALEQILLSPHPTAVLVLAKVLAHWLVTGLPLILVAPLLGVLLALPADAMWVLVATLALGTPVLSLVGAIGTALTVGLRRGGVLLSLLNPKDLTLAVAGGAAIGAEELQPGQQVPAIVVVDVEPLIVSVAGSHQPAVDERGQLDTDALFALLDERVKMLAIGHVSNALGTISPVAELTALARAVGALVLLDGWRPAQSDETVRFLYQYVEPGPHRLGAASRATGSPASRSIPDVGIPAPPPRPHPPPKSAATPQARLKPGVPASL